MIIMPKFINVQKYFRYNNTAVVLIIHCKIVGYLF